jgi:hypothetical protein
MLSYAMMCYCGSLVGTPRAHAFIGMYLLDFHFNRYLKKMVIEFEQSRYLGSTSAHALISNVQWMDIKTLHFTCHVSFLCACSVILC